MKKCLIIGGGAAGLMCAAKLAKSELPDLQITIIEQKDNIGYKLLASGNGRCNLTNILPCREFCEYGFAKSQARFVRNAIYDFSPAEQLNFFAEHGVEASLVDGFHYFPKSQKSVDILNVFREIISKNNIQLLYNQQLKSIITENNLIKSVVLDNQVLECDFLVISCGGESYPLTGSNGKIFPILQQLGISLIDRVPALVGLQTANEAITALAGNVLPNAAVYIASEPKLIDRGELLFTRTGVSGPAILDLSGRVNRALHEGANKLEIVINLNCDYDRDFWHKFFADKRKNFGKKSVRNLLHEFFFLNLVDWLLAENNINFERKISELTKKEELNLVESLTNLKLEIIGNDGFKKAIATAGGVDLNEVDSKTLAAKKFNNLFFAGEVLDIDGRCGGYNLTWAFASGAKVATEIRKLCK